VTYRTGPTSPANSPCRGRDGTGFTVQEVAGCRVSASNHARIAVSGARVAGVRQPLTIPTGLAKRARFLAILPHCGLVIIIQATVGLIKLSQGPVSWWVGGRAWSTNAKSHPGGWAWTPGALAVGIRRRHSPRHRHSSRPDSPPAHGEVELSVFMVTIGSWLGHGRRCDREWGLRPKGRARPSFVGSGPIFGDVFGGRQTGFGRSGGPAVADFAGFCGLFFQAVAAGVGRCGQVPTTTEGGDGSRDQRERIFAWPGHGRQRRACRGICLPDHTVWLKPRRLESFAIFGSRS